MPEETTASLNESLQRILNLIARWRWWIVLPACAMSLATILLLSLLPNRYSSEATILVVQQQVPERYVTPTSTTDISKALEAMTQEVLSRARLLGIIDEVGLYPEKKGLAPEQFVELMRQDVSITPLQNNPERREINAFKISFIADSPRLAQQVTSRLTTLFIQQNLKTREDQATTTTRFLHEQMDVAKKKLTEQEQRLREFKMENLGELPEQQQGNLGILSGLQGQLQNVMSNLSRAQQQRQYLQSLIGEYHRLFARRAAMPSGLGVTMAVNSGISALEAARHDLARLQLEKAALLDHYTSRHPEVLESDLKIARQQALVDRLKPSQISPGEQRLPPPTSIAHPQAADATAAISDGAEDDASTAQLKSQLEANRMEIDDLSKEEQRLKAGILQYQGRLNLTPVREQQLTSILRDYELLKQNYADLLNKEQQSQLATTLEKQQEGQQFRLVNPPSLPALPSSPKRVKISLGGLAGGIFFGLALAFFMEAKDSSLHREEDVIRRFAMPLVVGIPPLLTPSEERIRAWMVGFEWFAGLVLVLTVFVAEFYVYRLG